MTIEDRNSPQQKYKKILITKNKIKINVFFLAYCSYLYPKGLHYLNLNELGTLVHINNTNVTKHSQPPNITHKPDNP